jgi:hypothetical protein
MAEGLKLNLSDFLLNRVVGESKSLKVSLVEKNFILEIFSEDPYLSEKFPNIEEVEQTIKILDRNFFYDIYKFSYSNLSYVIKIGEEADSFIFQRERDALESIKELNLSPMFFNTSSSEEYSYLLTSFEHSDTSKQLGLSFTYENIELLGSTLAKIHNATRQEENQREYFIDSIYSLGSYKEIMEPEIYDSMLKTKYFKKSLRLLENIKDSVETQIFPLGEDVSCLCHTNINPSCILNRPGKMKICNFFESFAIHPAWDLAFTSYKLELDSHPFYEKKFLEAYHAESFLKEEDYSLIYFKQMAYKLILYKLIAAYFYKMSVENEEMGSVLSLFQNYALIRDVVEDEFSESMDMLDEMFAPFIKNL